MVNLCLNLQNRQTYVEFVKKREKLVGSVFFIKGAGFQYRK